MAKNKKSKSKDSAVKNTLNPPTSNPKGQREEPQTLERQVGQFTGEGVPSLQKK
jgi:hypothetical protein